jgi:hypothetical protein
MQFERGESWEEHLDRRQVLPLDPASPIAIKRDLHTFDVDVPAAKMAWAFHAAMIDTNRRFGLVQVFRKRKNLGRPFTVGERFQGCFRIRHAVKDSIDANPLVARAVKPIQASIARLYRRIEEPIHQIEDGVTSDFGEIVELELGATCRLKYAYLEGSIIAGSSTFIVEHAGSATSRVTQIFEYQEIRQPYVLWLGTSVLKMHLGVVFSQIEQAAELAGGRIIGTTVPSPYWTVGRPSSAPPPNVAIQAPVRVPGPAPIPSNLGPAVPRAAHRSGGHFG